METALIIICTTLATSVIAYLIGYRVGNVEAWDEALESLHQSDARDNIMTLFTLVD